MANWFQTYCNGVAVAPQDYLCLRILPLKVQVLFHNEKCICSSLLNGLFTTAQPHSHWELLKLEASVRALKGEESGNLCKWDSSGQLQMGLWVTCFSQEQLL